MRDTPGPHLLDRTVKIDGMPQITVTLNEETKEWLMKNYPDALNDQEALRMAVSDARLFRMASDFTQLENKDRPESE